MKKSILSIGAASVMLAMFSVGCASSNEGAEYIKEANEFIEGSQAYKTHEIQKDETANILLNMSEQLYLQIGAALSDNIKIRFGETDMMLLLQNVGNDQIYMKDWNAIKHNDENASAAQTKITNAIKQNLPKESQYLQKDPEELFVTMSNKLALNDYLAYKTAIKEENKEEADQYANMDAWLEKGAKELAACYGDEFKAAEEKRAKQLEESSARTKAEFEKMGNKVAYLTLWVAASSLEDGNMMKQITVSKMESMEKEYPYVKDILTPILKLDTTDKQIAYAKDLLEQYGYVLKVGGGRLAYTFEAIPWYFESKEALDNASGND